MLKIKNKLFDLLARNISLESFEQWLYTDIDVLNNVDSDEFILVLINRDFKDKHILQDLEKLCFNTYNKEEYLVYAVECICHKLITETSYVTMFDSLNQLVKYYDFSDDYELLFNFYCLHCEIECGFFGAEEKILFVKKVNNYSVKIESRFKDKSLTEKICFLINGMSILV